QKAVEGFLPFFGSVVGAGGNFLLHSGHQLMTDGSGFFRPLFLGRKNLHGLRSLPQLLPPAGAAPYRTFHAFVLVHGFLPWQPKRREVRVARLLTRIWILNPLAAK